MGIRFVLEHANFVSYLVSRGGQAAPRANPRLLTEFLYGLAWSSPGYEHGFTAFDDAALRLGGTQEPVISSRPDWLRSVAKVAAVFYQDPSPSGLGFRKQELEIDLR